ncbi:unnamed protein product, partial [Ilex paraguariensis]
RLASRNKVNRQGRAVVKVKAQLLAHIGKAAAKSSQHADNRPQHPTGKLKSQGKYSLQEMSSHRSQPV